MISLSLFSQSSVTYRIPAEGVTWSSLFRTVEEHKEELGIVDYSVSQTTLDQVSSLCTYCTKLKPHCHMCRFLLTLLKSRKRQICNILSLKLSVKHY